MSIYVTATAREFLEGLQFGPNNEVVAVNSRDCAGLAEVARGMILTSVNGTPVGRAVEEQRRHALSGSDVMLVFLPQPFPRHDGEFDLSSGEDEDGGFQQHNPTVPGLASDDNAIPPESTSVLADAAERAGPGKCIIIMSEGVNPAYPIAVTAERAACTVMYINTVARLKTRQSLAQAGDVFRKSLKKGLWIYIEQATKSISLLRKLAECIVEAQAEGAIHNKARIFLMCEPHPHFPEVLLNGGITLRGTLRPETGEVQLESDLLESRRGLSLVRGATGAPVDIKTDMSDRKRRVKISHEVSIVPLEKHTFMELSQSATAPVDREANIGEGIARVAKYTFGANEKFISLCKVKDGRYAVGTTGGYVLILDVDGLPLIQFRPHKACVWDVAFASAYDFATACEDGTSSIFNYSLATQDLAATSVASFQSDVFAVTYANPEDPTSAVLSGGLSATICVLHSDRQCSSFIASGMSIQAMRSTQRRHVLIGGGSGVCSLIDPATCTVLETTDRHQRKVPAVASYGDTGVTGGFDKMLRLWDVRSGLNMISEKTMSEVVTAVAVDDRHIAVCSGSDLVVWDVRKFTSPLAGRQKAWKDLTRGLVIDDDIVITASADGVARFWSLGTFSS
ncbi:Dynein heavy chain region D6 P-loop domain [Trypanosoma melophagium]|uniref:Dynein heavy chain region D6 P-loop domain n=1 Tax=Trypanosoma melophagium TaxID=715481 RepID=UPI00351A6F3B|nr:Dynein heavy chain region D6 P-loop domain [Trypanosoma melophagium]